MSDNKFERCEREDDPLRCQGIGNGNGVGQCMYRHVPGSQYCPRHGGGVQLNKNKEAALKNYKLTQYQARVGELSTNPEIKNLREEIGILRMTLENILNQCETANKLLLYTDKITNLTDKIEKLVRSCQHMEEKNNNLLDRKVVFIIADSIVTLVAQYIEDPDIVAILGEKICASITAAGNGLPDQVGSVT
jgi:hypothetical protein